MKPDYFMDVSYIVGIARELIGCRNLALTIDARTDIPKVTQEFVERLYEPNRASPHFSKVVEYWRNRRSAVIWLLGENAFADTLSLAGLNSDPLEGKPGELRYSLSYLIPSQYQTDPNQRKLRNIVHRSDSDANRIRELGLIEKFLGLEINKN